MTLDQAVRKAHQQARKAKEIRFVVLEDGYHVCTDEETVTYFHGAEIVYSTADRGYQS